MPQSKTRRRSGRGEIVQPLSKLDRIGELLKIQVETFPPKELTSEEIARWEMDLGDYSLEAIEYAFDNWRRNGRFFPVPGDIEDGCKAWSPAPLYKKSCSPECRERHGQGYGENDVLYLFREHAKKRYTLDRPLNESEWDLIYAELDKLRGGPPEWTR